MAELGTAQPLAYLEMLLHLKMGVLKKLEPNILLTELYPFKFEKRKRDVMEKRLQEMSSVTENNRIIPAIHKVGNLEEHDLLL